MRREHPRRGAPQHQTSRPHRRPRRRRRRDRRRVDGIAGDDRARHRARRAGLGAEPQPAFLHEVPLEAVAAGPPRRAHARVDGRTARRAARGSGTASARPRRSTKRSPSAGRQWYENSIGGIVARVPRQPAGVGDGDRHVGRRRRSAARASAGAAIAARYHESCPSLVSRSHTDSADREPTNSSDDDRGEAGEQRGRRRRLRGASRSMRADEQQAGRHRDQAGARERQRDRRRRSPRARRSSSATRA